jgi:hypothetical protein
MASLIAALLVSVLIGAIVYLGLAYRTWRRYGRPARPNETFDDPLLDRFMPHYDVVERHAIVVDAPPAVTLEAAMDYDIGQSRIARCLFKTRALILGARPEPPPAGRGLVAQVKALGWGELAVVPGREIVVGAVTQPWRANVTFRSLRQTEFEPYDNPGFVKIAWTLRADPLADGRTIFSTETRARATDPVSRRLFRRYWAMVSPGVGLIRRFSLSPIKLEAERRAGRGPLTTMVA